MTCCGIELRNSFDFGGIGGVGEGGLVENGEEKKAWVFEAEWGGEGSEVTE
jgi:hypothetical protein